ncbi:hypothetical protein SDC9_122681 [bioreactor metagenome]|uniref:Uncharacterized protein n=1 Tax=bioreactor metagenome TaxID=1076179 RepID=A0A645CFF9_9ZZZZ
MSGNDQWCAGFIDQDRVDLIDDRKVQRTLHHLIFVDDHIVPQIIKAQFIVGAVGDVAVIGFSFFFRRLAVCVQANSQPQETVEFTHLNSIAACQIFIDGDNVDTFAR